MSYRRPLREEPTRAGLILYEVELGAPLLATIGKVAHP
jgi:hypothetical protein